MKKQLLNGLWQFYALEENHPFHSPMQGTVPGSLYKDLLDQQLLDDPFYRDNEDIFTELTRHAFLYQRSFIIHDELLQSDRLLLVCEGLDTLATISLNGQELAKTNNMHCTYEFDVKSFVKLGENQLSIRFDSPNLFMEEHQMNHKLWASDDALPGISYLRKAHSMSGWDWGPKMPDLGIWRDIYLLGIEDARIADLRFHQDHIGEQVTLRYEGEIERSVAQISKGEGSKPLTYQLTLTNPDGSTLVHEGQIAMDDTHFSSSITIDNPKIWWPKGYGEQPLYRVLFTLRSGETLLDQKELHIGLRTLTVRNEKDEWGDSFEFVINGISIFSMGANYIPEDSVLSRSSKERTEALIQDCIEANYNTIRVWGGGIYPPDYFYELCDQYGLIVWQDFMFACAVYPADDDFKKNIAQEVADNVKRIRHHASLALWCGNNEMETGFIHWNFQPKRDSEREEYLYQYETLIPQVLRTKDTDRFYWPSSPSSGGGFDDPGNPNRGDVHYWDVWHGLKPFTDYRNYFFRFASEFGFQSFPDIKTIESFTLEEDRNIFSYVMEKHQKNGSANGKIMYYLSQNFQYPKDFDSLVYTSQLLQAEAIKYGVEHWRRHRGRCMGSLYWQLNDCWPVASWASIDYFGRWKALHYFAKRFYAPQLISVHEEGNKASIYVTNDRLENFSGRIEWELRNQQGIIKQDSLLIEAQALSALNFVDLEIDCTVDGDKILRSTYLSYRLIDQEGTYLSGGTTLFVPAKHFEFKKPEIHVTFTEEGSRFRVEVCANEYCKYVEIRFKELDCVLSDNFFDLYPEETRILYIEKTRCPENSGIKELSEQLQVRSLYDSIH
jgi:beta-mannosidase